MFDLLFRHGADADVEYCDCWGATPLHRVIRRGFFIVTTGNPIDAARALLEHGADPEAPSSYEGKNPYCLAVEEGCSDIVELFLDHGADPNIRFRITEKFFDYGLRNINKYSPYLKPKSRIRFNITPLHIAAEHNHPQIARVLIEHGANIEAKRNGLLTPLHYAASNGSLATARVLVDAGADANAQSK